MSLPGVADSAIKTTWVITVCSFLIKLIEKG